jgi:hypothetical protein
MLAAICSAADAMVHVSFKKTPLNGFPSTAASGKLYWM